MGVVKDKVIKVCQGLDALMRVSGVGARVKGDGTVLQLEPRWRILSLAATPILIHFSPCTEPLCQRVHLPQGALPPQGLVRLCMLHTCLPWLPPVCLHALCEILPAEPCWSIASARLSLTESTPGLFPLQYKDEKTCGVIEVRP